MGNFFNHHRTFFARLGEGSSSLRPLCSPISPMPQFYSRYVPPVSKAPEKTTTSTSPIEESPVPQFYARYIPPVTKAVPTSTESASPTEKRKRDEPSALHLKQSKKLKTRKDPDQGHAASSSTVSQADLSTRSRTAGDEANILDKYRVTAARGAKHSEPNSAVNNDPIEKHQPKSIQGTEDEQVKRPERRRKKDTPVPYAETDPSEDPINKHVSILSKFEQARQQERVPPDDENTESRDLPPVELHGLEPIPQPEEIEYTPVKPTYSTLPSWQNDPVEVPLDARYSFKSLGVPDSILENLYKHGLKNAFPVQSTILPLLIDRKKKHDGDICVSASTGSGKTLAYVIPIIASLREFAGTKLRAVIVVPTRELVKQVRELCEICAAGSRLRIATAVGSSSLKDEQDQLVMEESVYNPHQYEIQQQSTVDWSKFSLERLVRRSHDEDLLDSVGFVTQYRSKVDILITTPGRLVDHLKSTPGFNLDDVKWLVVDEADRLLNESYQEWIEVVSPALTSNATTEERDRLLRSMRMNPPRRQVRKILLSATMTSDISKLNTLGLFRPLLVVLGSDPRATADQDATNGTVEDAPIEARTTDGGSFHLPASLTESVVTISDPSHKPLYLLHLLSQHLQLGLKTAKKTAHPGRTSSSHRSLSSSSSSSSSSVSSDSSDSSASDSSSEDDESDDDSSSLHSPSSSEASAEPEERPEDASLQLSSQSLPPRALIFTRSTAAATRLARLLLLLKPSWSGLISTLTRSTASSASSRRALSAFSSSKISILIATDRASRGLDVPGLEHVISYDVPNSALTYVHRVGRTARAGNQGYAWTLLEHREGAWFWREVGGKLQTEHAAGEHHLHRQSKVKRLTISIEDSDLKGRYEEALQQLGEEARG